MLLYIKRKSLATATEKWIVITKIVIFIAMQIGEWPSGLYSLRQVTEVKLGRVRSDFGWVTSED